jgi:AGCS family alanine or glycine:cation symporter
LFVHLTGRQSPGAYVVSIGFLLLAFCTALAWSYYGDKPLTYLFGPPAVLSYRLVYLEGFFVAAQLDTSVIWNMTAITMIFMALPNLVGMLLLHRDMESTTQDYW